MTKKRRVCQPHIVAATSCCKTILSGFANRCFEIEEIDHISDEMRAVVESEWPELAHKLLPKTSQR